MIHSSGSAWKPFVRSAAEEVDAKFPRNAWTSTYPRHGEIYPDKNEANVGQYAIDFMIETKAQGDEIASYLWDNRDRLGLRYVIWYRKIISKTNLPSRWRDYTNPRPELRGTPSGDHTNHVHASFFSNGTYTPLEPETYPQGSTVYLDKLKPGVTDSNSVWQLRNRLNSLGFTVPVDPTTADYDTQLGEAVKAYQQSLADGKITPDQARLLFKGSDITIEEKA